MRFSAACLLVCMLFQRDAVGQVTYDDVAVVVNSHSAISLQIGNYFQNARGIPGTNMIYVNADTTEEVDSIAFESIRLQIENHLVTNNLVNAINYIVTTKGLPLKVNRGNTFSTSSPSSSVESEIACLLGSYASYVGKNSRITSPYWLQNAHFTRSQYGVYLVTRLDGYTFQQVFDLIDRSGPGLSVSTSATFVFDQDPNWDPILSSLNTNMVNASETLSQRGKSVEVDSSNEFLVSRSEVIGYVSWGSNDYNHSAYSAHAIPNNSWSPGSIAETYVSTSGRTFQNPPEYGQSLVADLVAEGITGAKGYVFEPLSSAMANVAVLFDRYTNGYNLAESYYMSSRYLSWMDVIIGDPKTSIDGPPLALPVQLHYFNAEFSSHLNGTSMSWGTISETNNFGFVIQWKDTTALEYSDIEGSLTPGHGTTVVPQHYSWTHEGVGTGAYFYRLKQIDFDGTINYSDARLVLADRPTSVYDSEVPVTFGLEQNYPNPFNPQTTIAFSTKSSGRVVLKVYSGLGQEIATLVDQELTQGRHSASFSGDANRGIPSGTYFYRLETADGSLTRKMMVLK